MLKPDDAVPDAELMLQLQQQLAERKRLLDMQLQQVSRLKEEREEQLRKQDRVNVHRQQVIADSLHDSGPDAAEVRHPEDSKTEKQRMRIAKQKLDDALAEFNRVVSALQAAKEALAEKRAAAAAAKARYKALAGMMSELIEMAEAVESSSSGDSASRAAATLAARQTLLALQHEAQFTESGAIDLGDDEDDEEEEGV